MMNLSRLVVFVVFLSSIAIGSHAQLSADRISDIAEIKVERFQNILDLTPAQATQLKRETVNMLVAQGTVANSKDIIQQINLNAEKYYASLTSLKPQQVATLKLMDSMERQSRRASYQALLEAYGQSSEFANAVAAYNWNVVMPIVVSYRKDLDRYISAADQATLAELREAMITKYNFINAIRENKPSVETEAIVAAIQEEIITDIKDSAIPRLLKKYDERLIEVRKDLKKYEQQINKDVQAIYENYMVENMRNQINSRHELLSMLGITNLLRDSFFLLLDGDSRSESFKINALHLMASGLTVTEQF